MRHGIRNTLLRFLAIGVCLAPAWSNASTLVVTDSDQGVHGTVAASVARLLADRDMDFEIHALSEKNAALKKKPDHRNIDAVITIGSGSMKWLAGTERETTSLSLLTTKEQFFGHFDESDDRHSVVYLNQPLERIVEAGKKIIGDDTHFVIFDQQRSDVKTEHILGSPVTYSPLTNDSVIRSIRQLNRHQRHVVVALPSHSAFTPITIKNTLISAYKARIPIVGYSQSFTRAGALFSVHADLDALSLEARDWIDDDHSTRQGPSRYYYVTTNPQIANSLGIKLAEPWSQGEVRLEATP